MTYKLQVQKNFAIAHHMAFLAIAAGICQQLNFSAKMDSKMLVQNIDTLNRALLGDIKAHAVGVRGRAGMIAGIERVLWRCSGWC